MIRNIDVSAIVLYVTNFQVNDFMNAKKFHEYKKLIKKNDVKRLCDLPISITFAVYKLD